MLALLSVVASGQTPAKPIGTQPPRTGQTTFLGRQVTYVVQNGKAIIEGDIVLGDADAMPPASEAAGGSNLVGLGRSPQGVVTTTARLWPNRTIAYVITPDLPNPQRVLDAVQHYADNTQLRLVPRSNETNYVLFVPTDYTLACTSNIGMAGGAQQITMPIWCSGGALVHEIGHAFGLQHEQIRSDRNANETILWDNIDKRFRGAFEQSLTTADVGYFDFDSIMHYGAYSFSRNGQRTITSVPLGIPMGQRVGLSPGDIDVLHRLYGFIPQTTTITTTPPGLDMVIDGEVMRSPQVFNWERGSTHTIAVNPTQGASPQYRWVQWTDGGPASHVITVSDARTVVNAQFARYYRVSARVLQGSGTVSLNPASPDGYYPDGAQVRVRANPAVGSNFLGWSGGDFSAGIGPARATAIMDVTATTTYLARFTTAPVTTFIANSAFRELTIDGFLYTTPASFAWAPGSKHTVMPTLLELGDEETVRYRFANWDDSQEVSRTITAGTQSAVYQANFVTQFVLTTSSNGLGTVTVNPSSADQFYDEGTTVQVSVQTPTGFALRSWLGDLKTDQPNESLVMSEDRYIYAYITPPGLRVGNGASNAYNPGFSSVGYAISPSQVTSIYGAGVGPPGPNTAVIGFDGKVSTTLAGMQVTFDGILAPILFAGPDQLNVITPVSLNGRTSTTIRVLRNNVLIGTVGPTVLPTFPGIVTADSSGSGLIVALNENGTFRRILRRQGPWWYSLRRAAECCSPSNPMDR
jgi:astacin